MQKEYAQLVIETLSLGGKAGGRSALLPLVVAGYPLRASATVPEEKPMSVNKTMRTAASGKGEPGGGTGTAETETSGLKKIVAASMAGTVVE